MSTLQRKTRGDESQRPNQLAQAAGLKIVDVQDRAGAQAFRPLLGFRAWAPMRILLFLAEQPEPESVYPGSETWHHRGFFCSVDIAVCF